MNLKYSSVFLPALIAFMLVSPLMGAAAEIAGSTFRSGNWTGNANSDNRGVFQYCGVGRIYQNGYGLNFSLSKHGEAILSIYSPQGRFLGEKSFRIGAVIDNQRRFTGVADVLRNGQGNYASAIMGSPNKFIRSVQLGNTLVISSYLGDLQFDLRGTAAALRAAENCVKKFK